MDQKQERFIAILKDMASRFLSEESNRTSLITVTDCSVSPDMKKASIYITVLPENREATALDFAKRKRGELREFLKKNMSTKVIPFIDIEIDRGEKNRQKIDAISKNA